MLKVKAVVFISAWLYLQPEWKKQRSSSEKYEHFLYPWRPSLWKSMLVSLKINLYPKMVSWFGSAMKNTIPLNWTKEPISTYLERLDELLNVINLEKILSNYQHEVFELLLPIFPTWFFQNQTSTDEDYFCKYYHRIH